MTPLIIGIVSSLLFILIFHFLKQFEKAIIYGLLLSAIGFLYVGFTWSSIPALIITAVQAFFFLLIAYYGIKKNMYFLAAGYIIHGLWDIIYTMLNGSDLIPPHYDLFCSSFDFIVGIYLLIVMRQKSKI
ncbi:DUF6010 family protein [Flavobacterium sp. ZS1P14]|uniref:DUF6010 family protein n=1 Tax=Flavobacterium sp. ZS1P14 TaxID=3401729 RepID=UPI003AAA40E5